VKGVKGERRHPPPRPASPTEPPAAPAPRSTALASALAKATWPAKTTLPILARVALAAGSAGTTLATGCPRHAIDGGNLPAKG